MGKVGKSANIMKILLRKKNVKKWNQFSFYNNIWLENKDDLVIRVTDIVDTL